MPIIVSSGLSIEPRIGMAFGTTIGISLLFILYVSQDANKIIKIIVYALITIIFILNFMMYLIITNQHILVNKLDKENCEIIKEVVEKYEAETNIKVTRIAGCSKEEYMYYPGFIHAGAITQKALNSWASREAICYYLGRHLDYAPITEEQYAEFFAGKKWEEFSTEQIVIEDGVLYFCGG